MKNTIKKLYRSVDEHIIAGVCGGIAEYFGWDPSIVRLVFVLMTFGGGGGLLVYIILVMIIPKEGEENNPLVDGEDIKKKVKEIASDITDTVKKIPNNKKNNKKRGGWFGWILLLLGAIILCDKFLPFGFARELFWPIIMVSLGLYLILK